jgi:predicted nucleic acid-binding Zn ribbon protein
MPTINYNCPDCDEVLTVYVKLSEPPMHRCGNSSHQSNWKPLVEISKKKVAKEITDL